MCPKGVHSPHGQGHFLRLHSCRKKQSVEQEPVGEAFARINITALKKRCIFKASRSSQAPSV